MKKRKKEILHNKEQSTEQQPVQQPVQPSVQQPVHLPVQSSVQQLVQHPVQFSVQQPAQFTVWSNDTYVYGTGMLAVLAIGVFIFFAYNASQAKNKKLVNEKQDQPPKMTSCL